MPVPEPERMMQVNSALMIHGAGGGGWEWDAWRRVFAAAGWRVSTPDLQPAAAGIAATRLADYEAQARDWIRELQPEVVIGASLGGLLALSTQASSGTRRVLVNPLPPAGWPGVAPLRRTYPDLVSWRTTASLASTARALPDADAATWHRAWRCWRDESGAVMNAAAAGISIAVPEGPVLVVVSAQDDDVPATTSKTLARALAADVLDCAGASHVGPLLGRSAPAVAERVLAWLRLRS